MSRQISLDELNKLIDSKIEQYDNEAAKEGLKGDGNIEYDVCRGKSEALEDLKHEINEPRPIEDVSENLQQTFNVEETKKIINKDELH